MKDLPKLPDVITYSGAGPGGEYYSKENGIDSFSLWTKGEESWTADELRAIADHQDALKQQQCKHENTTASFGGYGEHEEYCDDCGKCLSD